MKNYVVTGFDENYWHLWGSSWLISLLKFTNHNPEHVAVAGFNLSSNTQNKIRETGAAVICGISSGDIRSDTLRIIADLAKKESAIFAYWDADVFFQEDISEIFKIAKDDLTASLNCSHGFLAGPSHQWMCVQDVLNIMSFMNDKSSFHECLISHFGNLVAKTNDTWNFTNIPHLKDIDGKLAYKGQVQKVIHPSGQIKSMLSNKNILFWERYKQLHQMFDHKKIARKLVLKSVIDSK